MPHMTPERWQRVTWIVDQALACNPGDRPAFVRDLCVGDDEMRREVESLLSQDGVNVSILESHVVARRRQQRVHAGQEAPRLADLGRQIGPYRILEQLGKGGMGTVFLAIREGAFHKRVALKRIQRCRATDEQLLYRFENERQILANLEHPNVARILDGGVTEDDLPYFTMEYIRGLPIDRYCDEERLEVNDRLELFLQVCAALQLAHQNLVVHRDLKPGNILVTPEGVPKLIDFGIAKHLEPEAALHDIATETGHGPMTPSYASPEQLQKLPITTATDIYSLGVLLYRLLTGLHPYPCDLGTLSLYDEICNHEPVKPSVAVEAIESRHEHGESTSRARGINLGQLSSRLAGDLDSIVLKTLRKRPEDRYRSVEQLAEDLRRHLAGLPVGACSGTFPYLFGKFIRRHRRVLAVASVILLILTASGLAVTMLWRQNLVEERQADIARAQAEQARAQARRTADLLIDLLEVFDPLAAGNRITPSEFLGRAQQMITNDLRGDPELLAELLSETLAKVYRRLGHYDKSLASLDEALVILRTLHPSGHPRFADVMHSRGGIVYRMGDYDGAEADWRQALEMRQHLGLNRAHLVATLSNLAMMSAHRGNFKEAAERYRQVLDIQREVLEKDDPNLAMNFRNLGNMEFIQGQLEEGETLLRRALAIQLKAQGAESLEVADSRSLLARILHALDDLVAAEEQLAEAMRVRRMHLAADHIDLARTDRTLAMVLLQKGELPTVEILLSHAQVALRRSKLAGDWEIAEVESLIGAYLAATGDYAAAEPCLLASYHALHVARGPDVIYTRQALRRLVRLYEVWERPWLATEYLAILNKELDVAITKRAAGRPAAPSSESVSEDLNSVIGEDGSTRLLDQTL